jgi:hypothetical protein
MDTEKAWEQIADQTGLKGLVYEPYTKAAFADGIRFALQRLRQPGYDGEWHRLNRELRQFERAKSLLPFLDSIGADRVMTEWLLQELRPAAVPHAEPLADIIYRLDANHLTGAIKRFMRLGA